MKHYSKVVEKDVEWLLSDLRTVLPQFAGTTILVTGAGGFLMSYIVDTLVAQNAHPSRKAVPRHCRRQLQDRSPGAARTSRRRPEFPDPEHDVSMPLEIDEPIDWIVHGASIASPTVYRQFPLETIKANVDGTQHLLTSPEKIASWHDHHEHERDLWGS